MKKRVFISSSAFIIIAILVITIYSYYDLNNNDFYPPMKDRSMPRDFIELNLRKSVIKLSDDIGSRGYNQKDALDKSIEYISAEFKS